MGRRTLLLIASILVAAVGTALIGLYVRGADSRAQKTVGTVSALVALENIPPNTPVETAKNSMHRIAVSRNLVGKTGFTGVNAFANLSSTLKGQFTSNEILANQVIQKGMFAEDTTAVKNGITLGRGVAIELTDPARAAGLLVPGSHVTVYETDGKVSGPAKPVIDDATVMRIGNQQSTTVAPTVSSSSSSGTSSTRDNVPRTIVTLDLTPDDAALVIGAQARGELYFAVHGPGAAS